MYLTIFLILFPLVAAFAVLALKGTARSVAVNLGAAGVAVATIALLLTRFHAGVTYLEAEFPLADKAILLLELLVGAYLFWVGIKARKPLVSLLVAVQVLLLAGFELTQGHSIQVEHAIFVDKLSLLMAVVVGIVGSLICVFATGYMQDFHEVYHKDLPDRRSPFFFLLFLFLSARFGIIFSNNLLWLYFFWEITTLCSFLLI